MPVPTFLYKGSVRGKSDAVVRIMKRHFMANLGSNPGFLTPIHPTDLE